LLLETTSNKAAYDGLITVLRSGGLFAFAGTGVSAPLRYPTWTKLIEQLAEETRKYCGEQIQDTMQRDLTVTQVEGIQNLLTRAEIFKFNLKEHYFEFMQQSFGERDEQIASIQDLVDLPFRHFLTSNYDPALELAHTRSNKRCHVVPSLRDDNAGQFLLKLSEDGYERRIVHVHGRYDHPRFIILTEADYGDLYDNTQQVRTFWDVIAVRERCVFLGFSFSDQDIMEGFNLRNFNRVRRQFEGVRHYAFIAMEDADKDSGERANLNLRYGVQPIFFKRVDAQFSGYSNVLRMVVRDVRSLIPESIRRDVERLQRMTDINIKKRSPGDLS
jgi:hypothetical protein